MTLCCRAKVSPPLRSALRCASSYQHTAARRSGRLSGSPRNYPTNSVDLESENCTQHEYPSPKRYIMAPASVFAKPEEAGTKTLYVPYTQWINGNPGRYSDSHPHVSDLYPRMASFTRGAGRWSGIQVAGFSSAHNHCTLAEGLPCRRRKYCKIGILLCETRLCTSR
jgi:hypothetical protein